jgi:hypothetical protein
LLKLWNAVCQLAANGEQDDLLPGESNAEAGNAFSRYNSASIADDDVEFDW